MTVPSTTLQDPYSGWLPLRGQTVTGSYHAPLAQSHQRIANLHAALLRDPEDQVLGEQLAMAEADHTALLVSLRSPSAHR